MPDGVLRQCSAPALDGGVDGAGEGGAPPPPQVRERRLDEVGVVALQDRHLTGTPEGGPQVDDVGGRLGEPGPLRGAERRRLDSERLDRGYEEAGAAQLLRGGA